MFDFNLGYREVIIDQPNLDQWKEITLNTGGSQGTLQDIKISERSDGYCYRYQTKYHTRNRFIYWRINHDILELIEHSLDINLAGNRIRYKFVDTPILDGVSVHETFDNVIILVPTVCTVHRLVFPHPDKYHPQGEILGAHPDLAAPSIFSEANASDARNPNTFHFFTNPTVSNSQLPYLADSTLILSDEEAIFILAYQTGELLLVKQSKEGKIICYDLKNETIMPRFLSGLADKLRQKDKDGDTTVSLLLHTWGLETYGLTLLRNGQLKFWSCSKGVCIAVIDIVAETDNNSRHQIQGVQNHILKKAVDGDESDCILGIFLSFTNTCQLHVFQPIVNGQHIRLIRLNTLHLLQDDLIDFTLSITHIWTIWRTSNGNCEVYTSSIQSKNEWIPVLLEKIPDSNQPPYNLDNNENDPRQVYLQHIFEPGRFPLHIISKALNIYKKSTIIGELNLSTALLKQQICMAVETEIQNELKETVVNDDDYIECANYCWQRFYSCCVQYHIQGLKPLGLLLLPYSSGAVFLKKSMISFLRPLDIFEHILYNNDYVFKDQITNLLNDNIDVTDDVLTLFQVIDYLNQQVSEIFGYTFEKELSMLRSPDIIMSALLQKIQNEMDNEFTDHVVEMLSQCTDLYQAIHKTLELLRIDNQQQFLMNNQIESPAITTIHNIFTSNLGIALINGCLRQQIQTRFLICRNLLLISNIILEHDEFDKNIVQTIKLVCIPEISILIQANFVSLWLSNLPVLTNLPTESAMLRLSSLKLNPVFNFRINHVNCVSLLELFIGSTGGYEARQLFAHMKHTEESLACWHLSLLPYLNSVFYIIWPISGGPTLAEWLLSCGQHLWLQQFVRLLNNWCEWNSATYDFLVATSLLTTGEHYKALKLFKNAAKGVCTDQFLIQRISTSINDSVQAYITYCIKVINLFELHKASDCAINLANTALNVINIEDPLTATLYSIKFKHHLILKNYKEAYDSLNSNPDTERKKDNLRDLIKHLLDEKQLDILMEFKYNKMEELFINILFTRARASSDINNVYYDILYAYQMKRGQACLRLAASIMYEQSFRLRNLNNIEALEKQYKCLLAAKNALHISSEEWAFIVIPKEPVEEERIQLPKDLDTDEPGEEFILHRQITIVDLEQLKQELLLIRAKLRLIRFNNDQYCEISTPVELITLLTASGLFKIALELCQVYQLSNEIVFQNLTKKCVTITKDNESMTWKWLIENDLQDLPANRQSAREVAWNLLQQFLYQYEDDGFTIIHKIVCSQLLKMRQFLPHWLLSSYKERNPSELFNLYYNYGLLEEATEIATGYIMAALGYGKEYYGFRYSLQPTKPSVCLPISGFLNLLQQLKYINDEDPEKPLLRQYENFRELFGTYLETAQRVSNDMCNYQTTIENV